MKVAIMQPYFLPYLEYIQLINSVDKFIIYDDVNYIKSGYINRNRLLYNGEAKYFNINLDGASSYKLIKDTYILDNKITKTREKNLNMFRLAYSNAPFFDEIFPILEQIINYEENNIALFNLNAFKIIFNYLGIEKEFLISSDYNLTEFKAEERVINICKYFKATEYINASGGKELYSTENFAKEGIRLRFIKNLSIEEYQQFDNEFVPNLSIVDVMMFNSKEKVIEMLNNYELED